MFVLAGRDVGASESFYRDKHGFEVHEIGDPGWRICELGACRILGIGQDLKPGH